MSIPVKSLWLSQIKELTNSLYLDIIGVILVISVSMSLGYHNTIFNFKWDNIGYYFPLGIFSIINTSFSMIGTRLVTKKNNIGNFISDLTNQGMAAFCFGKR